MPPARSGRFAALYARLAAFNVEDLFIRKKEPGPKRTVYINQDLPDDYYDKKKRVKKDHVYTTNQVITSKYTIITFLPRNLLEQFRRIANIFFLGIAILQFFNEFSTISPGLVILPLVIVLGITAIKDGYEDIKRHQSDRRVNHTTVRVLEGGDFMNQNAVKPKSKTFVRAIVPKRLVPTTKKPNAPDIEKAEANPTEELSSPNSLPQSPPDIELDDDVVEDGGFVSHTGDEIRRRPHWKRAIWEDVRVGDIVKLVDNESFPADILICATSEDENVAFVETKNLDGETNLKSRTAVPSLTHLRSAVECAKRENAFSVDLDRPDTNMFKLNATVVQKDRINEQGEKDHVQFPADIGNMLLRGTVLRNTAWVIGVVLFTGEDTKIVLNSGGTPSKRSKVERQMNPQVFLNLILLAMMAVACAVVDSINEHRDYPRGAPWLYGANKSDDNPSINGLITWAFALITFQNIVPISLYISIEAVRTCQALFIYFDTHIFYEKTGQATLARSWNLSDDLGQIEYIFSDKTGTLTQNKMVFRQCSIGAKVYIGEPDEDSSARPSSSAEIQSNNDTDSSANSKPPAQPAAKTVPFFHSPELASDLQEALHSSASSPNASHARALNGFFSVLALCHTVLTSTNKETGKVEYKAQSPDEEALVRAAADVGYVFRGRDREILYLETPTTRERAEAEAKGDADKHDNGTNGESSKDKSKYEKYELLNVLEFNSARKRMSVVVRKLDGEKNKLFLLSKGADNVIFERLKEGVDESLRQQTEMHLSEFANEGLRTLTLAYKIIPEDEYEEWSERYHEATVTMENREERIDEVSDELEQDLRLLGATAIEDSLQDGVPETIADLKRAGIKVWVATGDKLETAIAIGHSTNLISRESNIIVIRGTSRPVYDQIVGAIEEFFPDSGILDAAGVPLPDRPSLHRRSISGSSAHEGRPRLHRTQTGITSIVGSDNGDRPGGFVLVIEGTALGNALSDETNKDLLLRLGMLCEGVICCRVSPLQKALVVRMVKNGLGAMTLAIGDGANDVSMIQAADVGVGIAGEEGLQAVNSSDYAIAQFRFLKRLLLVHGHWSYARNGNMILNFFYKNIVCIGVLWWFQIYDAWSSAYAFEYTYLIFWNAFWTLCPVIAIGIFDRIVDDHVLMDLPELYRYGREGRWFGMKWFVLYMLDGVYQSAVIFFFITYTYSSTPTTRGDGYSHYLYEFSTTMVFAAVMTANLFNGLNTSFWSGWVFFAVFIGIVLVWVYTAIYNIISPGWFVTPVYGNNTFLFHSAIFWFCLPLTIVLALAPRYLAKAWKFIVAPDDIDIMRWQVKADPHNKNYAQDAFATEGLRGLRPPTRQESVHRRASSRRTSIESMASATAAPTTSRPHPNQSMVSVRSASRMDMSTGVRSVHRGFDFSVEEGGPAIQRIQTGLSERRKSSRLGLGSLRLRRKKSGAGTGIGRALSVFKKKS